MGRTERFSVFQKRTRFFFSFRQYVFCYCLLSLLVWGSALFLIKTDSRDILSQEIIWKQVQRVAAENDLDPKFVYSIVFAESSFNPYARTEVARGLMQLTRPTWEEVSSKPYGASYDWRLNLEVGTAYLKWCKGMLEKNGKFSYPLLAATYHYGFGSVKSQNYDLKNFAKHSNQIYQQIFAGNYAPVVPPSEK